MRSRTLQILAIAMVLGLWGSSTARAQADEPAPAPAPALGEPADSPGWWAGVQRAIRRSAQELRQRDMWTDSAYTRLAMSPYTQHFTFSDEHRPVFALGVERHRSDGWLAGASIFRNSFGQPSAYVYLGRRFDDFLDLPPLFAQVSAGLLYGYKGAYSSKVPLNFRGFSPGALLTLGLRFENRFSVAVHQLGSAGVMLQLAYDLP